jgi:hypothetical protein
LEWERCDRVLGFIFGASRFGNGGWLRGGGESVVEGEVFEAVVALECDEDVLGADAGGFGHARTRCFMKACLSAGMRVAETTEKIMKSSERGLFIPGAGESGSRNANAHSCDETA